MTKQEYVAALSKRLEPYPQAFRQDIINAFEEHFQAGLEAGQSEEEIMDSLGTIDEVMQNIEEYEQTAKPADEASAKSVVEQLKEALVASLSNIEAEMEDEEDDEEDEEEDDIYDDVIDLQDASEASVTVTAVGIDCDVTFTAGEVLSYKLHTTPSLFQSSLPEPQLHVEVLGNDVTFTVARQRIGHHMSAELYLTIPSNLFALSIETSSGDIKGEGVHIEELTLRSRSGDIELEDASVECACLNAASGDIKVEDVDAVNIETRNASGDQELQHVQGSLEASCASGEIEIEECNGLSATISVHSGEIEASDIEYSTCRMESFSGDIEVSGSFENLTIESKSGDVELELDECPSQLNITTVSGDIEVTCENDDYTAVLSTVSGDIEAPGVEADGPHKLQCGDGNADFNLRTTSGDIELHD